MKLPKGWNKMDNSEQRSWIAEKIKQTELELKELLKISRTLQSGKVIVSNGIEDRPDLAILKDA